MCSTVYLKTVVQCCPQNSKLFFIFVPILGQFRFSHSQFVSQCEGGGRECGETLDKSIQVRKKWVSRFRLTQWWEFPEEHGLNLSAVCLPCQKNFSSYHGEVGNLLPKAPFVQDAEHPTKGIAETTKAMKETSRDLCAKLRGHLILIQGLLCEWSLLDVQN